MPDILKHWKHTLTGVAVIGLTVVLIMGQVSAGEYVALVLLALGADAVAQRKKRQDEPKR